MTSSLQGGQGKKPSGMLSAGCWGIAGLLFLIAGAVRITSGGMLAFSVFTYSEYPVSPALYEIVEFFYALGLAHIYKFSVLNFIIINISHVMPSQITILVGLAFSCTVLLFGAFCLLKAVNNVKSSRQGSGTQLFIVKSDALGFVIGVISALFLLVPGILATVGAIMDCMSGEKNRAASGTANTNGSMMETGSGYATPSGAGSSSGFYRQYWRKGFTFSGRMRRRDYWLSCLANAGMFFLAAIVDFVLGMPIATSLFSLAVLIPTIASAVRRLHDTGKSGWWFLLVLVPIVGMFVVLLLCLFDSQAGTNIYGDNPKAARGLTM